MYHATPCKEESMSLYKNKNNGAVLSAKLVTRIPLGNSLGVPDKAEIYLLSKPDNLKIVVQVPTWPKEIGAQEFTLDTNLQNHPSFHLSAVTIHPSNKQD